MLRKLTVMALGACLFTHVAAADPVLNAAIAPNARTGVVNAPLTVFASLTNSGDATATNCIVQDRQPLMGLDWRKLNPDNTVDGSDPNTPFTVAAGATQSLLLTFRSPGGLSDMPIDFSCGSFRSTSYLGLNTVSIWSLGANAADIIPIVVTPSGDSVIRIGEVGGISFMAAAAVNIGAAGTVYVRPSFWPYSNTLRVDGSALLPLAPIGLSICETGTNGACLAPPTTQGLTVNYGAGQTRTFTVFADAYPTAGLPFMPDINRVFLSFTRTEATWLYTPAGLSSAAIVAPKPAGLTSAAGIYNYRVRLNETTSETEWNILAMISPSGQMLAYGGAMWPSFAATMLPYDTIPPSLIMQGNLTLTPSGQAVNFSSANMGLTANNNLGLSANQRINTFGGAIEPGLQISGASQATNPGTANALKPLTFRGVPVAQLYDRPRTMTDIAGSYALGVNLGTATISSGGFVLGQMGACTFTGTASQPTATKNLFEVSLVFPTCTDSTVSGKTLTGLFTSPDTMHGEFGFLNSVHNNPLIMVLTVGDRTFGAQQWNRQ